MEEKWRRSGGEVEEKWRRSGGEVEDCIKCGVFGGGSPIHFNIFIVAVHYTLLTVPKYTMLSITK